MVGKIIYSSQFVRQLDELSKILYQEEYFGFIEDVDFYIDKIYDFIEEKISFPITKISPQNFQRHGKKYLRYKANHQTSWYIFFDEKNGNFLVNYILNNHDKDFPELI